MPPAISTELISNDRYWQMRALETERQLSCAESESLRTVYSQLLCHYRRMAALYGKHHNGRKAVGWKVHRPKR